MLNHLFTQLIRSLGIFFRTIRAFFSRRLVGITARARRLTNFSRQAAKVASESLQGAASLAKKPSKREDYIETERLLISKSLLLTIAVGLVIAGLVICFVIWPFVLSHFFTARFYMEDGRLESWSGRVIVYADPKKTLPLYSGRLEEGVLEGRGVQYDSEGLVCYEGQFSSGVRNGHGAAYSGGILVYKGQFTNDSYEGDGVLYEAGEMIYQGQFLAGVRSGQGKRYEGGSLAYEGQFQEDVPSGQGISYYKNGKAAYRGGFAAGLYEGSGTAYDADGNKVYQGGFSQGVYSGEGSLYMTPGQRIDASFAQGEPEGAVKWYKDGILYYEGEWNEGQAQGAGVLYSRAGKVLYQGQLSGGTLDMKWLLGLGLDELREALGQGAVQEAENPEGGFTITGTELGLTALCSYQQEGEEGAVYALYLFQPGGDWVQLLPGQGNAGLTGWPQETEQWSGQLSFAPVQGVPLEAGVYEAQTFSLEGEQTDLLFDPDGNVVLYRHTKAGPPPQGIDLAGGETGGGRMDSLLAALDLIEGSAIAGGSPNPYYSGADPAEALAACAGGQEGSTLMESMLLFWENAQRRAAAEENLSRAQVLLDGAQTALAKGTGDEATVEELKMSCASLQGEIQTCIGEMEKAALTADAAAGVDPSKYDLDQLPMVFDPGELELSQVVLVAAAYAQAIQAETDSQTLELELKTALVDLAAAYETIQTCLKQYETGEAAVRRAAGAYAVGTGSREVWFAALNARNDIQSTLISALSAFDRQAVHFNKRTGGWLSREADWYADEFSGLFACDVAPDTDEKG